MIFFDERDMEPTPENERKQKITVLEFPHGLECHDLTAGSLLQENVIRALAFQMSNGETILPGDILWEVGEGTPEQGWRVVVYEHPDEMENA